MSDSELTSYVMELEVDASSSGLRLDQWLAIQIDDMSRARIQTLIRDGHVQLDGAAVRAPRTAVRAEQMYAVTCPPPRDVDVVGEDIPLDVVYEDEHLIVINKPAGLVVHPAHGHETGTLVNALIAHCGDSLSGIGGVRRPGIVHRLDKDTSGVMVVAKTDAAHQHLSEQFKAHGRDGRLTRTYLALCWGVPVRPAGTIDAPLTRSVANRKKIAVAKGESGREAITHFVVVESFSSPNHPEIAALMRLQLETGRTHQIRVHLAHIGHPVVADEAYGAGFKTRDKLMGAVVETAIHDLARQALHAETLGFEHPETGENMLFTRGLPEDMAVLVDAFRAGPPA